MAYNPKSLENFKNVGKAESGNPSGRPKGLAIFASVKDMQDWTKEELETYIADGNSTALRLIGANYLLRALNGDAKCAEYLIDRVEGKPTITQDTNVNVQGLQQIGQDVSTNDTKQVQSIVNTITEASSAKDELMNRMNTDIVDTNTANPTKD